MFPNLTAELLRRGYTDEEVVGIFGGNILRVFQQVEDVATRLQAQTNPPVLPEEDVMWFSTVDRINGTCRSFG